MFLSQALSGGHYKHVIGRPIYQDEKEDSISMAFLCSPPSSTTTTTTTTTTTSTTSHSRTNKDKTISLGQQALAALILTLIYQFFVYICKKFWSCHHSSFHQSMIYTYTALCCFTLSEAEKVFLPTNEICIGLGA